MMVKAICCTAIALIAAVDRLIKYAVLGSPLIMGDRITLIPGILQLRYVENTGAAFSILSGRTLLLAVFSAVVIVAGVILILSGRIKSKLLLTAAVMLLGGGLGNVIDRFFQGYVIDYIEVLFIDFPVFNFADCFVTAGSFVLMAYFIWSMVKDSRRKSDG